MIQRLLGLCEARIYAQRGFELGSCLAHAPQSRQHHAQVAVQFGVAGTVDQCVPITRRSLLVMARVSQFISPGEKHLAQVLSCIRILRALGKHLGRPKIHHVDIARALALRAEGNSWRATARALGVHPMAVRRALTAA